MRYAFDIPKFLEWVVKTWAPVYAQADHSAYSRSHYSRLFSKEIGETPRALRGRLQLEAAAYLLQHSGFKVGEVAMEVGYATPEALAKAFNVAYGCSPRAYRKGRNSETANLSVPSAFHSVKSQARTFHAMGAEDTQGLADGWLTSSTGIHFHPSGLIVRRQGAKNMNLTHILVGQHFDEVTRILGEMAKLTDEQLDMKLAFQGDEVPWDRHEATIRDTVRAIILTHELWLAALRGDPLPELPAAKPSVIELDEHHQRSGPALKAFIFEIEEKDLWASEFVDALCDEPVRFAFGAVIADILVFGIHRRMQALSGLRQLGVKGLEYGDPINWLRAQSGEEVYVPDCD